MGAVAREVTDPTVYREEDDVGEHEIQTYILELLRPLVERYLAERGVRAHVGSDQYIYYREYDPTGSVAPDLYILPGVAQDIAIGVWKVWQQRVVPSFALEIVGSDAYKDYEESPRRYAELGVSELIVFDPFPGTERRTFQVYRRSRGSFRRALSTSGDRVRSRVLGCFLRVVGDRAGMRLRLATGNRGQDLFPTAEEAARSAEEAARSAEQRERNARRKAEARVAELEAALAGRKRK